MFTLFNQISLIRYLIVWRVNSSVVFLPRYLSIDLSRVLGSIFTERLPSSEKTVWEKALKLDKAACPIASNNKNAQTAPSVKSTWPIDAVLFTYPGKRTYGRDELIFWSYNYLARLPIMDCF